MRGPEEAASDLRRRFSAGEKTGILYGRERWGLNNDEVSLADVIVTQTDPIADIRSLEDVDNIRLVMKDGRIVKNMM